jgi:membrane protease YdiL (CAAX protease family)
MGKGRWIPWSVALVGLAIAVYLFKFDGQIHGYDEYLVTNIGCLLFIPMLYIFLVARQEPASFGFTLGDSSSGFKYASLLFVCVFPVLFIASRMTDFQQYYPLQKWAQTSLRLFLYFELTYGLYLFCWEFFFRGFLLFGLFRGIGWWAVPAQALVFGILHWGKPGPEIIASFITGVILGIVALKVKSFMPCFLVHWAAAVTFDILVITTRHGTFIRL